MENLQSRQLNVAKNFEGQLQNPGLSSNCKIGKLRLQEQVIASKDLNFVLTTFEISRSGKGSERRYKHQLHTSTQSHLLSPVIVSRFPLVSLPEREQKPQARCTDPSTLPTKKSPVSLLWLISTTSSSFGQDGCGIRGHRTSPMYSKFVESTKIC
jgi:hypothetical protein